MRRWFLSYHSPDQALAERLKAAIERMNTDSRVFFAPAHLRAGGFWSAQLAQEIADATAFVLLIGEHGLGDWQVLEYDEALDRRVKEPGFPLILVLREGATAPGLPFLRRLHWIVSPDPASEKDVARLLDAAGRDEAKPGELWRYTSPYRGLASMDDTDSDYFFGREQETVEVLEALAVARDRITILLGNSGVGKSSLAKAGVLAALKRQSWPEAAKDRPWPAAFKDSRRWCFLTLRPGTEPLKSLVEPFLLTWQFDPTDPRRETRRTEWISSLLEGRNTLSGLLDATEARLQELQQPKPAGFLLYIDQGEELYVRGDERQRHRFSELIAQAAADPRIVVLMSLRADFLGAMQNDRPLFKAHRPVQIAPMGEPELREVVSRPADVLGARFERAGLAADLARRAAEETVKDAGALPLLSYLLDDMWTAMVERGVGELRLPGAAIDLGGALARRADDFLAQRPGAAEALRRLLTLKLATVREGEEPTRRRALRSEFNDEEWHLVSELADHPNRLLVTATPESGETYAEVAHEAIFRRWDKLRDWIMAEREFLIWKAGLETARRGWQATRENSQQDALLMGAALSQAQSWLARRAEDLSTPDRDFIGKSIERERKARARVRRARALVYVLLVGIIVGLVGVMNQDYLKEQWREVRTIRPYMRNQVQPYVLSAERERALKPLESFRECAPDAHCPEMVVLPSGQFIMGSPPGERGSSEDERPQHRVAFATPFAVSRFAVTFDEWDACVAYGDCDPRLSDDGWGRGRQPAINVVWDDAQRFVAWLNRMIGKTRTGAGYRLLSEAEYEYATRAGTSTAYFFGDDPAGLGDYAWSIENSGARAHPVGEKKPNPFGLYDMNGNVFSWVEDCVHYSYNHAPDGGAAWGAEDNGECARRVMRGGSWINEPAFLRSAQRIGFLPDVRNIIIGFRVARTLIP